jgi:hypothetical protein
LTSSLRCDIQGWYVGIYSTVAKKLRELVSEELVVEAE